MHGTCCRLVASRGLRHRLPGCNSTSGMLALLLLLTGCGGSEKQTVKPKVTSSGWATAKVFDDTGKHVDQRDLDGDGRADFKAVTRIAGDPTTKVRTEWDLNHDGKMDVWQFYGPDGVLQREELDLDWDGRTDIIMLYENGVLSRKEIATNFRGVLSVRKHYDHAGNLNLVEQDRDEDGKFDTWEFYEGGKLVRIGRDTNGDGREDTFTEPSMTYKQQAEEALRQARAVETETAGTAGPSDAESPRAGNAAAQPPQEGSAPHDGGAQAADQPSGPEDGGAQAGGQSAEDAAGDAGAGTEAQ